MRKSPIQIFGFLISTIGWFGVCCTLAMNYWRTTYIGGQGGNWIIKAAWYWSNLWRDCYTDTTDVSDCKDYDVFWVVNPTNTAERRYIQAVRGLLLFGMAIGFFAAILCFIGMDCTYLGGSERTNDKILLTGAVFHFIGGMADAAGYCLFTTRLGRAAFARLTERGLRRYEIGLPVYLGLVGSFCIILGSVFYAVSVYRVFVPNREVDPSTARKNMAPQIYVPQTKNKTLFSGEHKTSTQSRTSSPSSIQVSGTSHFIGMSDRDTFV